MGRLGDPANTFWQLVAGTPSGAGRVVTPPGVADNGGLVASSGVAGGGGTTRRSTIVAGVLTSKLLGFSPVALSADGGGHWAPSALPGPLVHGPASFAVGEAGEAAALVGARGSGLYWSNRGLTGWQRTASLSSLAAAEPSCRLRALDDVGLASKTAVAVGGQCSRSGHVGFFVVSRDGTASALGGLVRGLAGEQIEPVSLVFSPAVIGVPNPTVLVTALAVRGDRESLVVIGYGDHRWSELARLRIPARDRLLALGEEPFLALLARGPVSAPVDEKLFEIRSIAPARGSEPSSSWTLVARPPDRTESVLAAGSQLTALVVHHSLLSGYRAKGRTWHEAFSVNVPIVYGSSS